MGKFKNLQDIFENDPFGLLNIKSKNTASQNEEERLISSFLEINTFYENNGREPGISDNVEEHMLYARLKGIRENSVKIEILREYDRFRMLNAEQKQIHSIADILNDDSLGLLNDDSEGLYNLKHFNKQDERTKTDFVAKRKPCKDFDKYEPIFKSVQNDLSTGKRKLLEFKQDILKENDFFVHNGILLLLENVEYKKEKQKFKSGSRVRKDGRTRIVFENGTESNMLYRSLYKALLANGKAVSENRDTEIKIFAEKHSDVTNEDNEAGFIYILKSKSDNPKIKSIHNLYKIGYSQIAIEERIKNANQEPTYLMADVRVVMAYKCFNMNTQKLEQLLHNFFGNSCLNLDVFDKEGNRHMPREWFIAPLDVIEQAIHYIISGDIIKYKYNCNKEEIVTR